MDFTTRPPSEAVILVSHRGTKYRHFTDLEVTQLLRNAFTRIDALERKVAAMQGALRDAAKEHEADPI